MLLHSPSSKQLIATPAQGNAVAGRGDRALAREVFAEAAAHDSACIQAHYNHG